MKPENQAHGQFTYFHAVIEDEYLEFTFNDGCGYWMRVTEDTLVQIYKELDDEVWKEGEGSADFMMEQQIEFTSNNELMLNFAHNYIFLKFSSKIEMKEFFAYFKKEIESSLELDKQSILHLAEIRGDKPIVPAEYNSLLRLKPQDIENFKIFKNAMRNKSLTEIEKDFLKIVDKIPLGEKADPNKIHIYARWHKYISEITKLRDEEWQWSWPMRTDPAQARSLGIEKEDMDLINSFEDLGKNFLAREFKDEVVQEAKLQVITIIEKELGKHDKITRSKIRAILVERGYPVAGVIDTIYEKYSK